MAALAEGRRGEFLATLDLFIVNTAFPAIRADFPGTTNSGLSWVLSAYAIVFAALLGPAAGGLLADADWRWIFVVLVPIAAIQRHDRGHRDLGLRRDLPADAGCLRLALHPSPTTRDRPAATPPEQVRVREPRDDLLVRRLRHP
jgi:MFS family permease